MLPQRELQGLLMKLSFSSRNRSLSRAMLLRIRL
jgi:hypothetical protein